MKYYSEEVVKKIITDAMRYGMEISQGVPMSADSYPSFEIPDEHGDLIDGDELPVRTGFSMDGIERFKYVHFDDILSAPVILEATK